MVEIKDSLSSNMVNVHVGGVLIRLTSNKGYFFRASRLVGIVSSSGMYVINLILMPFFKNVLQLLIDQSKRGFKSSQ